MADQLNLFAPAPHAPLYANWQPDPMSAPAHEANWTLMTEGVLRPGQDVWAALFREIADRRQQ
jgi:hypothetical protein